MSMFMTFIIIGLVWTVSINIITKVEKFGTGQSTTGTLTYFNQLSTVLPKESMETISNSFKVRVRQFAGEEDTANTDPSIEAFEHMQNLGTLKSMAMKSGGKTAKMDMRIQSHETVHLISLKSKGILKGQYEIGTFVLEDKTLIKTFERNVKPHPVLKPCFKKTINSRLEAFYSDPNRPIMAFGGYHEANDTRSLYYLENWNCNYDEIRAGDINDTLERKAQAIKYAEIPIESTSNILNLAADEDCVVYSMNDRKAALFLALPYYENGTWIINSFSYVSKFKYHQNIGLKFISDLKNNETSLLIVDISTGESDGLSVHYLLGRVVQPNNPHYNWYLNTRDPIQRQDFEEINGKGFLYFKDLFKVNYTQELVSFSPYQLQNYPNAIMVENAEMGLVVIVIFGKYANLLNANLPESGYVLTTLFKLPDQSFIIKAAAISESGTLFAFLAYSEWIPRIYIVKNTGKEENKVMVANLDYSENFKHLMIKDIKLTEMDDELFLVLLMDNSEILTYSMNQISVKGGTLYELFVGDHLNLISILFFVVTIGMIIAGRTISLD